MDSVKARILDMIITSYWEYLKAGDNEVANRWKAFQVWFVRQDKPTVWEESA